LDFLVDSINLMGNKLCSKNLQTSEKFKDQEKELKMQKSISIYSGQMAAIGGMAQKMAHEINTPLQIAFLYNGILQKLIEKENFSPEKVLPILKKMEGPLLRIGQITRGLLDLSADSTDLPLKPTPIRKIYDDIQNLFPKGLKEKSITFSFEGEDFWDLKINCRQAQISQVVANILDNSIEAIEGTKLPWIKLELKDLGKEVELAVIDSGPGVPEEIRDDISRPFFTTKELSSGQGTGLGLSVSAQILEQHGGSLYLDTSHPHTRFAIRLPKWEGTSGKPHIRTQKG